jgi:AcrR family transcriptional regulator
MSARAAKPHLDGDAAKLASSDGLQRAHVADIQRSRMLSAVVEVAAEHGVANVTVARVVQRAGISRRTFYEIFDDTEDCVLAAFVDGVARSAEAVLAAYRIPGRWSERMRRSLAAALLFFDRDIALARFLVVESSAAGRPMLERRTRVLEHLLDAFDEGRAESGGAVFATTRLTAEGVLGAVLGVVYARLADPGDGGRLIDLLNPLMGMIVLPYAGAAAARREMGRALPEPALPRGSKRDTGNPLNGLQMRLTYRTVRVLFAVADRPRSSNRLIGDVAGIADQGQISKLLARLEKLSLIENAAAGPLRGEPNAWTLTSRGEAVNAALGAS